jgi:hypothetical protein
MSKQIKDYPKWVQEIVIKRQIEQGNKPNLEVKLDGSKSRGNFNWSITSEKKSIWVQAYNGNLKPLANFHGVKIDENGEEVREMPIISQDGEKVIPRNVADYYQELFNHMNDEYGLILTISEMDEIIRLSELVKTQTFKTK